MTNQKQAYIKILRRRMEDYEAAGKFHRDNGNDESADRCILRAYVLSEAINEIEAKVK